MSPIAGNVGFVGLGNQGGPIAMRIVGGGIPLQVWARRPEALGPFVAEGAVPHDSLGALGQASDLVAVCVTTDDDVRSVVLASDGLLAAMRPGTSIAIHSTVHPDLVREVATVARTRSISLLDAPVSGGSIAANAGTMAVLAAGDAEVLEIWRPVFATYATTVELLGPVGAGQLAKLINNALSASTLGVSLWAINFAEAMGLDRSSMLRVLAASSGDSFMLRAMPTMLEHGVDLAAARYRKDVDLFHDIAAGSKSSGAKDLASAAEQAVRLLERMLS